MQALSNLLNARRNINAARNSIQTRVPAMTNQLNEILSIVSRGGWRRG
jgi:hypothetical protein